MGHLRMPLFFIIWRTLDVKHFNSTRKIHYVKRQGIQDLSNVVKRLQQG